MKRIKKGDQVVVIAGKDKGRQGTVIRVYEDERVMVENVNVVKKHQKPNPNAGVQGGIIEKDLLPIAAKRRRLNIAVSEY